MYAVKSATAALQHAFREHPFIRVSPPLEGGGVPISHKSEIKVYLPIIMIGELERQKRAGHRSKFIEQAIREKLDRRDKASLLDWEPRVLIANAQYRLGDEGKIPEVHIELLQLVIDELNPDA